MTSSTAAGAATASTGAMGTTRSPAAQATTAWSAAPGTTPSPIRRPDGGRAGRQAAGGAFSCEPPSTVAKVDLVKAVSDRLHDAGTLEMTLKVQVAGKQVATEQVVMTEAA